MAHLVVLNPPDQEVPVFFNVDKVVGAAPASNLREDTLLVQFFLSQLVKFPATLSKPTLLAACLAVKATGVIDAFTINAIVEFQKHSPYANTVVDGRISPSTAFGAYNATAFWTIVHLNQRVQNHNVDVWPRIDKIKGCPGELIQMVKTKVGGK